MILQIILLNSLIAAFIAYEVWLMLRDRQSGKGTTGNDRGTRSLNFVGIVLGLTGAGLVALLTRIGLAGGSNSYLFWIGLGVLCIGFLLRIWAVRTLGASFRTTIETHDGQHVITNGPYKLIRHPSYSGLLLICLGYGIAVQNWISLIIAVLLPAIALLYRIRIEEPELEAALGQEYQDYKKTTKRLIPWIW